jgi:DNA repair protein RadC
MRYAKTKELVLYGLDETIDVPEIEITYKRGKVSKMENSPEGAADVLRKIHGDKIEIQEQVIILFLDNNNNILGFYRHSLGGPVSTIFDIPLILAVMLKSLARSVIISHNHPSCNLKPSREDISVTEKLKNAITELGGDIRLLDHVIVTKDDYYSFVENGQAGLGGTYREHMEESNRIRIAKARAAAKLKLLIF